MKFPYNGADFGRYLAKKILTLPESPFILYMIGKLLYGFLNIRQNAGEFELLQLKRVLVIRLDVIGDVVMTTPFLRELRRNLPNAWITLVVDPLVYDLVENCPYVDEVFTYACKGNKFIGSFQRYWRGFRLAFRHLWPRRFDLAILPRWDVDIYTGTFLAYLSVASRRVGFSEKASNQKRSYSQSFDRLLTHTLSNWDPKHEVLKNFDLLRFLGGKVQSNEMEIWLNPEDDAFAEQALKSHGIQPQELLIGFVPGAGHPKRMWPLANFLDVGDWLKEEYHARIVVIGGQGEESLGQELLWQLDGAVINTVGQTTLRQTAAILKRCHLYVGNDSGLMHLAAAAKVPVVEISCHPQDGSPFHANSPSRFGPWGVYHRILQPEKPIPPCSDAWIAQEAHFILGVTVEQVKRAVADLLASQDKYKVVKEVSNKP